MEEMLESALVKAALALGVEEAKAPRVSNVLSLVLRDTIKSIPKKEIVAQLFSNSRQP